jgi:SAM-dependent methyltransferase
MRREFAAAVLKRLLDQGLLHLDHSILVVAGGEVDKQLFHSLGFTSVMISNLDDRLVGNEFSPYSWSLQNAQSLTFDDEMFDFSFVSDGLHHCSSPHKALLEMYRVTKRGVIVIESRDSLLMSIAEKLKLTQSYELTAVINNNFKYGGVDNTEIPNFIYRWTENEFKKTIQSFNPIGRHTFHFFYDLNLPFRMASQKKGRTFYYLLKVAQPFAKLFTYLFKKQGNSFSMVTLKPAIPEDLWPWLDSQEGCIVFKTNGSGAMSK